MRNKKRAIFNGKKKWTNAIWKRYPPIGQEWSDTNSRRESNLVFFCFFHFRAKTTFDFLYIKKEEEKKKRKQGLWAKFY
jgi:hypothetical protein